MNVHTNKTTPVNKIIGFVT